VLEHTFLLSGGYSQFRGRRWGAPVGDLPGDRFVIGIQNHDHVGNRARGERLASLVSPALLRGMSALMLLAPHLPFIFMGEEYGEQNPFLFFCSFGDPGLAESIRTGRKRDYALQGEIPDPQDEGTFTASRLSWSWPAGSHQAGLRQLYRHLLAARLDWPPLRDTSRRAARLWPDAAAGPLLELVRGSTAYDDPAAIRILLNLTDSVQQLPADAERSRLVFSSEAAAYVGVLDVAHRPDRSLLPYECLAFGPASCAKLAT
jgi:maltooligosyltrehalose trehalohydrolase